MCWLARSHGGSAQCGRDPREPRPSPAVVHVQSIVANEVHDFFCAAHAKERSLRRRKLVVRKCASTPSSPRPGCGGREQSDRQHHPCSQSCAHRAARSEGAKRGHDRASAGECLVTRSRSMASKVWCRWPGWCSAAGLLSLLIGCAAGWGCSCRASLALFATGAVLYLFGATSLGIFLGQPSRVRWPSSGWLLMMVLLPLQMLSGGVTDHAKEQCRTGAQPWMLGGTESHFVDAAQGILFRAPRSRWCGPQVSRPAADRSVSSALAHATLPQLLRHGLSGEGGRRYQERRFTTVPPIPHRPGFAAPCQGFGGDREDSGTRS